MKRCTKCKKLKSKSEFGKNRSHRDGLKVWCKKCAREYIRRRYMRIRGPVKKYFRYEESHRAIDGVKQKRCIKCKKWKDEIQFGKESKSKDGLRYDCKDCVRAHMRERYKKQGKGLKQYYRYEECHRVVDGVTQKRCRRCKRWRAESGFYKAHINKDGLAVWCKECANKATNESHKKRQKTIKS